MVCDKSKKGNEEKGMGIKASHFLIIGLLINLAVLAGAEQIKEKLTTKFRADINKDGKKELLVHDFYGGTAGYGELIIYNSNNKIIFAKMVEGDPYLWHPKKHMPALNYDFFPDLDKDGIAEILVGCRNKDAKLSHVDEPWWFDVYKWDGKAYVMADAKFPDFYKEQLVYYNSFVKEKGKSEIIEKLIKNAQSLAWNSYEK